MEGIPLFKTLQDGTRERLNKTRAELKQETRDAYEVSMLKVIDDACDARDWKKAKVVIRMHKKRFPDSIVRENISKLEAFIR